MARSLRVDVQDGWYHVMSRGTERRALFEDDRDRRHFLELLEAMVARYGVKLHAYVLMTNHYHLLLQTPHTNLSRTMQWLNVSYGIWFNRKHDRIGPLFQGRFKSVPIDGAGSWALLASEYLHLNPVRVEGLGLGKRERKAEGLGLTPPPTPEVVKARLEALRRHRWSSYPAYVGDVPRPAWLTCAELWQRAQHGRMTPTASYRWRVESPLKSGMEEIETLRERLQGAVAVGSQAFVDRLRRGVRGDRRTQPDVRKWQRLLPLDQAVAVVVAQKGEPWERFRDRHGDGGRDAVLWLGRRHCGLTLAELGAAAGGLNAVTAGAAIRRIEQRRRSDAKLQAFLKRAENKLSYNET